MKETHVQEEEDGTGLKQAQDRQIDESRYRHKCPSMNSLVFIKDLLIFTHLQMVITSVTVTDLKILNEAITRDSLTMPSAKWL